MAPVPRAECIVVVPLAAAATIGERVDLPGLTRKNAVYAEALSGVRCNAPTQSAHSSVDS
jgi:hypothetical protein